MLILFGLYTVFAIFEMVRINKQNPQNEKIVNCLIGIFFPVLTVLKILTQFPKANEALYLIVRDVFGSKLESVREAEIKLRQIQDEIDTMQKTFEKNKNKIVIGKSRILTGVIVGELAGFTHSNDSAVGVSYVIKNIVPGKSNNFPLLIQVDGVMPVGNYDDITRIKYMSEAILFKLFFNEEVPETLKQIKVSTVNSFNARHDCEKIRKTLILQNEDTADEKMLHTTEEQAKEILSSFQKQ